MLMIEMNECNCEKYSNVCFMERYESTLVSCYSKCYKQYDINAALHSNSNNETIIKPQPNTNLCRCIWDHLSFWCIIQ